MMAHEGARKEHCTSTHLKEINAKIECTTCGTAMQKTVHIKVNCEMSVDNAIYLAQRITEEANRIAKTPKDCKYCVQRKDCPEITSNQEERE